jgi:hypothetical protein
VRECMSARAMLCRNTYYAVLSMCRAMDAVEL